MPKVGAGPGPKDVTFTVELKARSMASSRAGGTSDQPRVRSR